MANLGKVLKGEIDRLGRKNALAVGKPLASEVRSLKRQLKALAANVKALEAALRKVVPVQDVQAGEEVPAGRAFTGKGIKSIRRKFKITQAELARLAKVSSQAVVMWERKPGKIRLRHATYEAMSVIRGMKKAAVKALLGDAPKAKAAKSAKAPRAAKAAKAE